MHALTIWVGKTIYVYGFIKQKKTKNVFCVRKPVVYIKPTLIEREAWLVVTR